MQGKVIGQLQPEARLWQTVQVCFERNVHARTLEDITAMAAEWEPTPLAFPQIDMARLLGNSKQAAQVMSHTVLQ